MKKLLTSISAIVWLLSATPVHSQMSDPPGQLVDLGGYNLHFQVMGSSGKTIVIEPGTGSWSLQWMAFQKELSKHFRVITYDRGGYGWSDRSPLARTADNLVHELKLGLSSLGIEGPVILLGHSYGGMIIKAFAKTFPDEVEALIFADAATEYQFDELPPAIGSLMTFSKSQFKEMGAKARKMELPYQYMPVDSTLHRDFWEDYQRSVAKASFYEAMYNELDLLPLTYEQVKVDEPFQKPVLVITAGNSFSAFARVPNLPIDESNKVWLRLQKELLSVSTNSQQKVLEGASHDLLLTASEELKEAILAFVKN